MDGYHKFVDGVKYPATLLTHGINNPLVEPWMSAKLAAQRQKASMSGNLLNAIALQVINQSI